MMSAIHTLRLYQTAIARAVLDSVLHQRGRVLTVEIASQGGARELSAQLECLLLTLHSRSGAHLVKVAPDPVTAGWDRLRDRLQAGGVPGLWSEQGCTIRAGKAEQHLLAPAQMGSLPKMGFRFLPLLEVANAQELEAEVYRRDLVPLAENDGTTIVLYGTPWNSESWFERLKQRNRQLAQADGVQRHFRVPWQEVARHSPLYGQYVARQRAQLGVEHPHFQTRYELRPLPVVGPLLTEAQRRGMQGGHQRGRVSRHGANVVASVRLCQTARQQELTSAPSLVAVSGMTVVTTVAELTPGDANGQGTLRVVDHRRWRGTNMADATIALISLLSEQWPCERVVVEAPAGQTQLAAQLSVALPSAVVEGCAGGQQEDSAMAMSWLTAVNSRRVQLYAADGSSEYRALRHELESARAVTRPGGVLIVELQPPVEGFLWGLLLLLRALVVPIEQDQRLLSAALAS
jgi:hypothetical protein